MSVASPDRFDALESVDWNDTSQRLTRFAIQKLGGRHELGRAEDLSQSAIVQVLDENYKEWDPAKESILNHLKRVVWGLISHHRTKHSTLFERLSLDGEPDSSRDPAAPQSLAEDTEAREIANYLFEKLNDSFEQATPERAIVGLFREGIDGRRDQVEASGLPDAEVRRARMRIERHALRAMAELENPDGKA